ncbi:tannase/feruloyl esterase family alpha/beta hydrolase [Streptomyces sp. NPDC060223]|uniref:tannase/feruloyl esterase family alpha/beta hydrolase n=1 Tax=unclassified Streptomyces TaxID=2593676 RepID=UPI00363DAD36
MNEQEATLPARLRRPVTSPGRTARRVMNVAALSALLLPLGPVATANPATGSTTCARIADNLVSQHRVQSAQSKIVPASGQLPAYCQVDLVAQRAINVRVSLPLSAADGGTAGAVTGAWNGRVLNMGGGGYAGTVPDVSTALRRGEVGSATDTGHSRAWCNATNPSTGLTNAQPDCGLAGGGFVLDPAGKLVTSQVEDFITRSLHQQTLWALDLTKRYYGRPALQNYWVGASTGGRQGWEMAQKYGDLYDGFLVGYPAINWNQFIVNEAWPAVVVNDLLGEAGLPPAKSDAANAAAIAACDADDGVVDQTIAEPRRCGFDASEVAGLSPAQAEAVNLIWDGPTTADGGRLWGGITRGTTFNVLLPGGNSMGPLIETYLRNWLYQDPNFDWREKLTMKNFAEAVELSYRKFSTTASTDSTDLSRVRDSGSKIIFYHGTSDPLIVPFGSYNYQQRLFDRYGVQQTRSFVRTFYFPGVSHTDPVLTGDAPAQDQMLDALQNWAEGGDAPKSFVQKGSTGRTRTICAYPDVAVAGGDKQSCRTRTKVPADLAAASRTS